MSQKNDGTGEDNSMIGKAYMDQSGVPLRPTMAARKHEVGAAAAEAALKRELSQRQIDVPSPTLRENSTGSVSPTESHKAPEMTRGKGGLSGFGMKKPGAGQMEDALRKVKAPEATTNVPADKPDGKKKRGFFD